MNYSSGMTARALMIFTACACVGCGIEHRNVSFDVRPDGTAVVFSSADGDLYLFHLDSRSVERLTRTAREESTPAFSPDGQRVAYAAEVSGGGKSLFEYSLTTKTTRQLSFDKGVNDLAPKYSPDGLQVAFTRSNRHRRYSMGGWTWDDWDVYVMHSDGANLRRLTFLKSRDENRVTFFHSGSAVLFSASSPSDHLDRELYELRIRDSDTALEPHAIETVSANPQQHGAWAEAPDTSKDGTLATFLSDRAVPFDYDVYVMGLSYTTPRPLHVTSIAHYNQNPRFAPDGKSVLFLAGTEENRGGRAIYSLWRVSINDGRSEQIADSSLFTNSSTWRPR